MAVPDRLGRTLPALRWLALAQTPQTTRPRLVPLLVPSVLPSTACTPRQSGTTMAGPYAWRATKTVTAHPVPLASSLAPPAPLPCSQGAYGLQARSTGVQGEYGVA